MKGEQAFPDLPRHKKMLTFIAEDREKPLN